MGEGFDYRESQRQAPELDAALDRLEKGQPLRPIDLQELSFGLGRNEALRLARELEAQRIARERAYRPRTGVWAWLFGPIHHARRVPLPDGLARLITRLRAGESLGSKDVRGLARRTGRRELRRLSRSASRLTASRGRALGRHARSPRSRRGRR